MLRQEWKPQDLIRLSSGYWSAFALHAAIHLDIFSHLHDRALTVRELAKAAQCDARGTGLLLTALCSMELMCHQGNCYTLTPFAQKYLCRQSPDFMGYIIEHQRNLVDGWSRLSEAVKSGEPTRVSSTSAEGNLAQRENFQLGMYNIANAQARSVVSNLNLVGRKHLLDLGGGPGTYAVHFCLQNPEMQATVYDLGSSETFAGKIIAQHNLTDRISFVAGDFNHDPLPSGCDVVWISQVLHGYGPEECVQLLTKVVRSVMAGTLILVQEFVVGDDRNGPEFPALFGLNMLVATTSGQSYTAKEITEMLLAAGVQRVERLDFELPQHCGIICGVV